MSIIYSKIICFLLSILLLLSNISASADSTIFAPPITKNHPIFSQVNPDIHIVYYVYLSSEKDWRPIMAGQLQDIKKSGILKAAHIHLVICGSNNQLTQATIFAQTILWGTHYDIVTTTENNFEYPGLLQMHHLAQIYPDSVFIYIHSKGMGFYPTAQRQPFEIKLLETLLHYWEHTYQVFKSNLNVQKAGLFPCEAGWIWFNFYWVRGSYLLTCQEPLITTDRYYYESWVGIEGSKTYLDCYSLLTNQLGLSFYSPYEACAILNALCLEELQIPNPYE